MPYSKINKPRRKIPSFLRWTLWVLLVQFILINVSAALHAYKFTHLYDEQEQAKYSAKQDNVFTKTWRLFSGPRFYKYTTLERPAFPFATIQLKTSSGLNLQAWYSAVDSSSRGTVILFHGLSGDKSMVMDRAYEFRYLGYNILMVDARSHGQSEGKVTTIGFRESEDVKIAYEYIRQKGEQKIVLWGFSMGAVEIMKAVAGHDLKPAGIILEAPFLSLQTHIKGRARMMGFPQQPYGLLISFWIGVENGFNGFAFNNADYAEKIQCPVLLQYGMKDPFVKKYEIDKIYTGIAAKDKKLVVYTEAAHESLLQKDPVVWRKEVEKFLSESR